MFTLNDQIAERKPSEYHRLSIQQIKTPSWRNYICI